MREKTKQRRDLRTSDLTLLVHLLLQLPPVCVETAYYQEYVAIAAIGVCKTYE
jgi:hypothetical protein